MTIFFCAAPLLLGIVGVAAVTRGYYVNPESGDEKLAVCDVKARERLKTPVTLKQTKAETKLADWALVRNSQLSVVLASNEEWQTIAVPQEILCSCPFGARALAR